MLEFLKLCKSCARTRLTESGLITTGPALVFSAVLVGGAGGPATLALHDSHGAFGKPVVDMTAVQSSTDPRVFVPPIYFDQAVYAEFGLNVTSVLVQFRQTRHLKTTTETSFLKSYLPSWLGGSEREPKST
jgi:hypothetical protein